MRYTSCINANPMSPIPLTTKICAVLLAASLCVPAPALALRAPEVVEQLGGPKELAAGMEEAPVDEIRRVLLYGTFATAGSVVFGIPRILDLFFRAPTPIPWPATADPRPVIVVMRPVLGATAQEVWTRAAGETAFQGRATRARAELRMEIPIPSTASEPLVGAPLGLMISVAHSSGIRALEIGGTRVIRDGRPRSGRLWIPLPGDGEAFSDAHGQRVAYFDRTYAFGRPVLRVRLTPEPGQGGRFQIAFKDPIWISQGARRTAGRPTSSRDLGESRPAGLEEPRRPRVDPREIRLNQEAGRLRRQGQWQAALTTLDEALQINPNNPITLTAKASILVQRRRYPEALATTEKALQLDPRGVQTYIVRAQAFNGLGQYPESEPLLRDALSRFPGNPILTHLLAQTLRKRGMLQEADDLLEKPLVVSPADQAWFQQAFGTDASSGMEEQVTAGLDREAIEAVVAAAKTQQQPVVVLVDYHFLPVSGAPNQLAEIRRLVVNVTGYDGIQVHSTANLTPSYFPETTPLLTITPTLGVSLPWSVRVEGLDAPRPLSVSVLVPIILRGLSHPDRVTAVNLEGYAGLEAVATERIRAILAGFFG